MKKKIVEIPLSLRFRIKWVEDEGKDIKFEKNFICWSKIFYTIKYE